ncbi:uncharacterized protein LOC111891341 [Lactuca sativa]|uniref:uncharacterized protein LOC111891341 n=1 Tax=Lactuca sativa TaxID=4236 RepID=UPI000CD9F68A|nr:uncharacterized protein LOC111891341 [Lactuca sativa]
MASVCESDTSYDSDDLCDEIEENEEIQTLLLCGLAVKGLLLTQKLKYVRRRRRSSSRTRRMLINEIFNDHESRCYEIFRLEVPVFNMLCRDLVAHYGLNKSRRVSIEESLGIFLLYLAHGCGNRLVQEFCNHTGETIHRHFHKFLDAVVNLSKYNIKPNANYNKTIPEHILNNPRYYPFLKDCIGAIDETHVKASVPQHDQIKFIGRKNCVTQNIRAACDFNMCFTFAWARWEETAHDTRIFNEARRRHEVKFPLPADGKYYLVDDGYPNTKGYLDPYKCSNIRYHIPDFRRGQTTTLRKPKGFKEKFNYYHLSLRNIIERTFGVWKARWVLLRDMHVNFGFETQVKIALASMAIHNYIRMSGSCDATFQIAQEKSYISRNHEGPNDDIEPHDKVPSRQRRNYDMYMSAVRDMIVV